MEETLDPMDILTELAEYIKSSINATGVYIARLEQTKKEISEDGNDTAHIDESGQQIIKFLSATNDHQFMIDKTLSMNEGITPDVFNPQEKSNVQPKVEEQDENKEVEVKQDKEINNLIYCKEVTREPRIKYFKVPRLGCYMAVPLIYSSYLFVEAFDAALIDYAAYKAILMKNEELTKEYEQALAEAKQEREDEENSQKDKDIKKKSMSKNDSKAEPEAELEEAKIEPPQLEEAIEPVYQSRPLSFVVCMDTLGQDREFTEEQKEFVFAIINKFRKTWEDHEKACLISDRELKEEEKAKDDRFLEEGEAQVQDEEDKTLEEKMAALIELQGEDEEKVVEPMNEDEKKEYEDRFRWGCKLQQLTKGVFKESLLVFQKYNVIKMPRIMQSLFYLLGFTREDLCEVGTNKLFWKKARELWNEELLQKFGEYTPIGPKEGNYKKYQTINFIEKNLEGFVEEEVQSYSLALARLFVCLQMTITVRKADILRRKTRRENLIRLREEAIQKSEERNEQRTKELNEKKNEALSVIY